MKRDLRGLLQEAAPDIGTTPDLVWIEGRVRRRHLSRVSVLAALLVLVVVASVTMVAGLGDGADPAPVIDNPSEPSAPLEGWPVQVRYLEVDADGGQAAAWEVAGEDWSSWMMVRATRFNLDADGQPTDPSVDGLALAEYDGRQWIGTAFFLNEGDRRSPFDVVDELAAGLWAERHQLEDVPDGGAEWQPPVAFTAQPASVEQVDADALVADDHPDLRVEVAGQFDLDPDVLVAFTVLHDDGTQATWVREARSGLALLYEERAAGEDEPSHRVAATDVRFDVELTLEAPTDEPDPTDDPDATTEAVVDGEWQPLPPAPVEGRQQPAAVWTGQELLIWGGVPRVAGAAYDPAGDSWRELPSAPLDPREGHVAVWTGSELLVWGGGAYQEPDDPSQPFARDALDFRADGAAYDPATDSWRPLADSPLGPRAGAAAVWTGQEMLIVAGTGDGADPGTVETFTDAAAYDPATDSWRSLPDLPDLDLREVGPGAVWTGEEMLVAGSRFAPGRAAAYDPASDTWREIDDGPLSGAGQVVAWTGDEAIITDTMADGIASYDPTSDSWQQLPTPSDDPIQSLSFVTTDGQVVAVGGKTLEPDQPMPAWIYDHQGQRWVWLDPAPVAGRGQPAVVWTGTQLLVWSGMALAAGDEAAAHDDGAAWYPTR